MKVLFVTHPEVVIDLIVSVPRVGLSARGRERMAAFCTRPELASIRHVYASDERKARDGAEMLRERHGFPVTIDPRLGENDRSATGYVAPPRFWEIVDHVFAEPETSILGWERAVDAQARISVADALVRTRLSRFYVAGIRPFRVSATSCLSIDGAGNGTCSRKGSGDSGVCRDRRHRVLHMRVGPSRWRWFSLRLLRHAASILLLGSSAWSIAMLREADYIENDWEVLFWASGCLAAAYRRRLSAALTPDVGRRFGRRAAYAAVMGVLGLGAINCASGKTISGVPVFEQTACDLPDLAPDLMPRIKCGTVAVPRDRASPQTGTFRLAVVVVKAVGSGAVLADPVVYVAGGPGSPLTSRAALIARHEAAVVAPDRDLILVDQRGAGRSEPALCPGLARQQVAIFANGADQAALVRAWRDSFAQCRRDMASAGLDPAWFGTSVTAADFEDVRQALGIERWNVYALSYGTAVASTMLAQQPAHLRAVVLDSVFPPDPLPTTLPQGFARALELLFAACHAQAACAVAHPDLAGAYRDALRTLDAAALSVPMPDGLGIKAVNLRAELFRLIVNRALYSRGTMTLLPAFIDAARNRDPAALQGLVAGTMHGYLSMSIGDMEAVECRDRPSWQVAAPNESTDPPVSAFVAGSCADWSPLGPPPLIAEGTQVPTLILAGRVDPITPPPFAWQAAAGMGQMARVVEFAHVGHGVQQASACGEHSVTAFIQAPASTITACAEAVPPVKFK